MSSGLVEVLGVFVAAGLLAGVVAYARTGVPGAMVGFFLIGMALPVLGIILACFAKRKPAPPPPPGWYADPWGQSPWRWYDGYRWTWQTG